VDSLCTEGCSVAIGVVALRRAPKTNKPQVLLIHRANPPATGKLCFPGGRLELGETLANGAARETKEETGIDLRCDDVPSPLDVYDRTSGLPHPRPVTVVDGLYYQDEQGATLAYHYAIIEVLLRNCLRNLSGRSRRSAIMKPIYCFSIARPPLPLHSDVLQSFEFCVLQRHRTSK
jgi:ADP-ribose pyrophosphatase YjhB (NUDIX family)